MYLSQSLRYVIILHEYKFLTHKPHSRSDGVILQYAMIAGLIQFALLLEQIPDFVIGKSPKHHNRAMLYGWCGIGGCSYFPNTSPLIWPKVFNIWFFRLKDFIPLLFFVLSLYALDDWSFLTLFCFLNCGWLIAVLPYNPSSQSLLQTVDVDTFFSPLCFNCAVMFKAVSLLQVGDTVDIVLCSWGLILVIQPYFCSCFIPCPHMS